LFRLLIFGAERSIGALQEISVCAVLFSAKETSNNASNILYAGGQEFFTRQSFENIVNWALPERAARRRIDPLRICEETKGGAERLREQAAAEWAVRQALRHAGIDTPVQTIPGAAGS
jgi:hypothetical protein